jgi:hypothetical protein
MKLRCLFVCHRPMLSSIIVREDRFSALCDHCGAPLERGPTRRWVIAAPLVSDCDQAA